MKRLLSIILAVIMIMAMLPTTFAAVDETTGAITYNFQIDYDFETDTGADAKTRGYVEYRNNKKSYTDYFTKNDSGYERNWAWLGVTVGSKKTNSVAQAAYITKDSADMTEYGKGNLFSAGSNSTDDYMAVKINIPTPGIYNVSDMNVYNYGDSGSASLEMYVLPASLSMGETTAGTVFASGNTATWGTLTFVDNVAARSGQKAFSALNIPTDRYVGTYSASGTLQTFTKADVSGFSQIIADTAGDYIVVIHNADSNSETTGKRLILADFTLTPKLVEPTITVSAGKTEILTGESITLESVVTDSTEADVTESTNVTYTSNSACVSVNGSTITGVSKGTAIITATATVDGKTVTDTIDVTVKAKVFTYLFNRSVLTSSLLENAEFIGNYRPFYYKNENGVACYDKNFLSDIENVVGAGKGSEKWAVSSLGGSVGNTDIGYKATSSITVNYLQMIGKKTLTHIDTSGDGRFVLELFVPSAGSYDITTELSEYQYGADADIYIIKKTESITEISHEVLKDYPIVGRIGNVTGKVDEVVGNYTFASAGNYYFVLSFNSENVATESSSRQYFRLESITLSEKSAWVEIPATARASAPSLAVGANISGATVTVTGAGDGPIYSVARGTTVTLSASEVEGYNFIGWMRGAYKENGEFSKFVDLAENEDGTYSYKVWSSIYLTAVYEPAGASDEKKVRFWNYDGAFLGEKPVSALDAEKLPTASFIGHTFTEWLVGENEVLDITNLTSAVTNAVAKYTANQYATYKGGDEVTLNGATQNSNKLFGTIVACNEADVTHWLRDGKVVAYGSTYNHFVWDGTHIHSSRVAVTPKPLVVLESTTVDGAYMIEYEAPEGFTIAEVGILFAASGTPNIDSATERFSSQRDMSRGQFAAMPTDDTYTARGYMIYEDTDGSYKVIYSD